MRFDALYFASIAVLLGLGTPVATAIADVGGVQQPFTGASRARDLHGRFLHITDIHMDKHYKVGATIQSTCHRKPKRHRRKKEWQGKLAGFWGAPATECDAPRRFVHRAIQQIADEWKDQIDFVIWTGDNARHDADKNIKRTKKEILGYNQETTLALQRAFRRSDNTTIPIVPCIGNNDVHPHNKLEGFNPPKGNPQLSEFADLWRDMIPEDQQEVYLRGGYYAVDVARGIRVLALNTLYFFNSNDAVSGCRHKDGPAYQHLVWMRKELERARRDQKVVYIIGHVPPTTKTFKHRCIRDYVDISLAYADVIAAHLYGHANLDHFQVLGRELVAKQDEPMEEDDERDITLNTDRFVTKLRKQYKKAKQYDDSDLLVVHVAPPLLPQFYPAFRVNRFQTESQGYGSWLQYTQWYANLTQWNERKNASEFTIEYSTDKTYGMDNLSTRSWLQLSRKLTDKSKSSRSLWNTYIRNMFVQTNAEDEAVLQDQDPRDIGRTSWMEWLWQRL